MTKVKAFIPLVAVSDIAKAVSFYTEQLGFAESWQYGDPPMYAGVNADEQSLHLDLAPEKAGTSAVYVWVEDVDGVLDKVKGNGVTITDDLGDREYGMREFAVQDLDGNTVTFGSSLEQPDQS